jgi:anti-sigma factor ChrR (cupin superfamily)
MTGHALPEDPAELAALYAAGALAPEEWARFEAHLAAGCPACEAELAQLSHVVAALGSAVEPRAPSAATREQLLGRLAAEPAPPAGEMPGLFVKRAAEGSWEETGVPGIQLRVLFLDREANRFTALVRMAAGSSYPGHFHSAPEECLVLEGDLCVGTQVLLAGDYQRAEPSTTHVVQTTRQGCLLLVTAAATDFLG